MAIGGALSLSQTEAQYQSMNSKLIGEAFSRLLEVTAANSNILTELQGDAGSKKPFVIKTDLTKGAASVVHFPISTSLGADQRLGTAQAVGYEETMIQGVWDVNVDNRRIVVAWADIVAQVATTGKDWREVYAEMVGESMGRQEQEDMLMVLKKRAVARNKISPNYKVGIDNLRSADVMDSLTITRAGALLKSFGCEPAELGQSKAGRPIQKYTLFAPSTVLTPLNSDLLYNSSLQNGDVRGDDNVLFDGGYQSWNGHAIKNWDIVDHDNPGPIGTTLLAKALLGDPIVQATTTFTVYGGGRTQATIGQTAPLYSPFKFFPGYLYYNYSLEALSPNANTYYFVVYDPADGLWCVYSYTGSTGNTGNSILIVQRLAASATGAAVTTLAGWTWNASYNKEAFPTGSFIFPVNASLVPFGRAYMWGANAGGKAYGTWKNRRIMNKTDYDNLVGFGIQSIYGCDARLDTLGFPRGFVMVECAVQHEGVTMPTIAG